MFMVYIKPAGPFFFYIYEKYAFICFLEQIVTNWQIFETVFLFRPKMSGFLMNFEFQLPKRHGAGANL